MTRVNTIDPSDLTDQWLIAEWRELPRIVNELEKHPTRFNAGKIPTNFTLGAGHVTFFRDKLLYLAKRHRELKREMRKRGITFNHKIRVELHYLNPALKRVACNDWTPSEADHAILIDRLCERFDLRKKAYHMTYNGIKHVIDCEHSFNWYCETFLSKYF